MHYNEQSIKIDWFIVMNKYKYSFDTSCNAETVTLD